ncbi:MAG: hypothetical protein WC632_06230 [Candidatus Margulisiibacteriota bacterium]
MVDGVSNVAEKMQFLACDVISSYEDRIASIECIFSDTHQMLDGFQKALLETREERESLSKELREKLAKTDSLRHKDFDQMMRGILEEQSNREKEVKKLLEDYLAEQKAVAGTLKEGFADFNKQLVAGEQIRLDEFKAKFSEIKKQQLARQDQVTKMLKGFQAQVAEYRKENEELAKGIRGLLSKGETIRIRDFKAMLKGFQEERIAAAGSWRSLSLTMAKKRVLRSPACPPELEERRWKGVGGKGVMTATK